VKTCKHTKTKRELFLKLLGLAVCLYDAKQASKLASKYGGLIVATTR